MEQPWPEQFERILKAHLPHVDRDALLGDASLVDGLGLDSLGVVGLVTDLEDEFKIEFPLVEESAFESARALWHVVQSASEVPRV